MPQIAMLDQNPFVEIYYTCTALNFTKNQELIFFYTEACNIFIIYSRDDNGASGVLESALMLVPIHFSAI